MHTKDLVKRVEELVLPICENIGVELWDVEFEKEGGQYMLTVTIDKEEGVDIDHCESVSRTLDPMLDAKEFQSMPAYTLCVSSAGLERRLKKKAHFEKFMGSPVELKLYKAMNGAKIIQGILTAYDEGAVTLDVDGETHIYEPQDIAAVRLTVQF